MKEQNYLRQLNTAEQERLFTIIRKYNWLIEKREKGEPLKEVEERFLIDRPHKVNDWLHVDLIEWEIVFISYKGAEQ